MVHILLKPGLEKFDHCFTSVWDKCKCAVVFAFLTLPFFEIGMNTDLFQSCGHCWSGGSKCMQRLVFPLPYLTGQFLLKPHVKCPIFSELFPDSHNTNNLPYFITFITHAYKNNCFISIFNLTMLLLYNIMNSLRTGPVGWIDERYIHKYIHT